MEHENIIHMMLANETHRKLLADWGELAPLSTAMFRADSARYASDPDFERFIAVLMETSPEFRMWWPRHDVMHQPSTVKRSRHPSSGQLVFEYMSLDVTGQPGMRFVVCTPTESESP